MLGDQEVPEIGNGEFVIVDGVKVRVAVDKRIPGSPVVFVQAISVVDDG